MGGERVQGMARRLEAALRASHLEAEVTVALDYQGMIQSLERGEALAAWGPPLVCAWAEAFGGRGLVRSVRQGFGTYRAAVVARRGEGVDLTSPGLRAAWVDRDSMAGYVLPQAMLRERGLRPSRHFAEAKFLESYEATLQAVLDRKADLTSVWASPAHASPPRDGVQQLAGPRASELEIIAYSRECPNDGVVAGPGLASEQQVALQCALLALERTVPGQQLIQEVFGAERLEESPPGSYRQLHETVFKALTG